MGNFSPFSFARLGRDALDLHYGDAAFVADFSRRLYRKPSTRRISIEDAIDWQRQTPTLFQKNGRIVTAPSNTAVVSSVGLEHAARIEPQGTNSIRSNDGTGAVPGVLGNGGSLPTGWTYPYGIPAENVQILAVGEDQGISFVRLRLTGTTTNSSVFIYNEGISNIVAASGDRWAQTAYLRIIGAPIGVSTVRLRPEARKNGGESGHSGYPGTAFAIGAEWTRLYALGVLSDSNGTGLIDRVVPTLQITTAANIDLTLDIGLPQMERNEATSPIRTAGAVTTRAADVATVFSPVSGGPFYIATTFAVAAAQPPASYNRVLEIYSATHRAILQVEGHSGQLRMLTQDGAGTFAGVNLGPVTPGVQQTVVMAFDGANSKGLLAGDTLRTFAAANLDGLDTLTLGSARGGIGQMAGGLLISDVSMGAGVPDDETMATMAGVGS